MNGLHARRYQNAHCQHSANDSLKPVPTERRRFLLEGTPLAGSLALTHRAKSENVEPLPNSSTKFNLLSAPHPGTFKAHTGEVVLAQIHFAAAQGLTAWEDNGPPKQSPEMQEQFTAKAPGLVIGMEHVNSKSDQEEETVLIEACHPVDPRGTLSRVTTWFWCSLNSN